MIRPDLLTAPAKNFIIYSGDDMEKEERILAIFLRGLRGEKITAARLANEFGVSEKSIARDISEIRAFLADNRELSGFAELVYSRSEKCYKMHIEDFLLDSELFAVIKILIGSRALSEKELASIITKLKRFASANDRALLESLIAKEKFHYCNVKCDCESVIDRLWTLARDIRTRTEISIDYLKMSRERVQHRIHPVSLTFSEYYFYLIAYRADDPKYKPIYFRVDRILDIIEHRVRFELDRKYDFDEGELHKKIQFMFPGKCRKIRFEFSGPSLQAVLDRLPTAVVLDARSGTLCGDHKDIRTSPLRGYRAADRVVLIEAEVYGTGIITYLLSLGSWVRVISPDDLVAEFKTELERMNALYN